MSEKEKMLTGTVSKYFDEKGFGFIKADSDEFKKDVFVHISRVEGADELKPGDEVSFRTVDTLKGPQAVDVELR